MTGGNETPNKPKISEDSKKNETDDELEVSRLFDMFNQKEQNELDQLLLAYIQGNWENMLDKDGIEWEKIIAMCKEKHPEFFNFEPSELSNAAFFFCFLLWLGSDFIL